MSESTTIEKPPSKKLTLKDHLQGDMFKEQVAKALPKHLSAERFIRVAVTALTREPKLAECDQASFFKALIDLSSYGLEPDGRKAHLIPFENRKSNIVECQLIIDYKGLAELILRSGVVSTHHADVVCENDVFEWDKGEIVKHLVDWKNSRGEPYAAYAYAKTKDGAQFSQVMTKEEIEKIRDSSQGYKAAVKYKKDSPWTDHEGEMWKKTAFRRLSKWLPLSSEIRDAIDMDERRELTYSEAASLAKPVSGIEKKPNPFAENPETAQTGDSEPEFSQEPNPKEGEPI